MNRWIKGVMVGVLGLPLCACFAATTPRVPAPHLDTAIVTDQPATAIFAGGCFWGVESVFRHTRGVLSAAPGYAGGQARTATYPQVSTGRTGHAESVKITYDPGQVSYGQLLQVFFAIATDPTQVNRQGPDRGPQYRSVLFTTTADQTKVAQAYLAQMNQQGAFAGQSIATTVQPAPTFYPAEAEHDDYAERHPANPYILMWDAPMRRNLAAQFPHLYRSPAL